MKSLNIINKFRIFSIRRIYRMMIMYRIKDKRDEEIVKKTLEAHEKYLSDSIEYFQNIISGREDIFLKCIMLYAENHLDNMRKIYEVEKLKNVEEIRQSLENFKEFLYNFLRRFVKQSDINNTENEIYLDLEKLELDIITRYQEMIDNYVKSKM